ncbi:MAG: selenium cofactor biosynthesis protein YqeC [Tissierellia bacterium]|nr:selenium cofactor biosynthesis protein YqeC [Tissierellia bacterium]
MKVISFTGSGGKTTLIEKIAKKYSSKRVLITTSTKIFIPKNEDYTIYKSMEDFKRNYIANPGIYVFGEKILDGKIHAVEKESIDFLSKFFDLILIEADGSKEKPLKAWRSFEPVIYNNTYQTIGVMPIDLIGLEFDEEKIFNFDLFEDKYVYRDKFDTKLYSDIINDPDALFKNATRKILYLSRSDLIDQKDASKIVSDLERRTGLKIITKVEDFDI